MPLFQKVLIANRGEIAVRIARTAKKLGIATAIICPEDEPDSYAKRRVDETDPNSNTLVDETVFLPGTDLASTFLNIEGIVAAALSVGADCVHPGYGFLSENATFARAVEAAGMTFIGPSADVIEQMGSKIGSKEIMKQAGVPVLEGSPINTVDDLLKIGEDVGWPLLVKASAGGGGRGMRIVRGPEEAAEGVDAAYREAVAAFGDGTLLAERFLETPRHIEIQVFGDHHGTVVDLFERDCSVQRRHQKVVEESPAPGLDPATREALRAAARLAAKTVGYVGAGTVEFIVDHDGSFAFLEMNTRLQVEHPVTEAVTGLDLVEWQFRVAANEPLGPSVLNAKSTGHAIEVRLCAEDPRNGFLPQSGRFEPGPYLCAIRADEGTSDGIVSPRYDSLLAKLIAHADTRDKAASLLAEALRRAFGRGILTNRDLLIGILEDPDFLVGAVPTTFLDTHDPVELCNRVTSSRHNWLAAAGVAWLVAVSGRASLDGAIPLRFRNVSSSKVSLKLEEGGVVVDLWVEQLPSGFAVVIDGETYEISSPKNITDGVDFHTDALHPSFWVETPEPKYMSIRVEIQERQICVTGSSDEFWISVPERFAAPTESTPSGSLVAPMPGSVVRADVAVGDVVTAFQPLVVLEAMKMEHVLRSPFAGTVTAVHIAQGVQVEAGALLVEVEEDPNG
ncbi:MAG: biotin carboxylase N-terminal domain-containing protein [Actinomycetota bacterium]